MTWVRDIRQDSASMDVESTGQAVIGYLWSGGAYLDPAVVANTPHLILGGDSGIEPLPMKGSSHPSVPSLKLDTYTSQCDGRTHRITANYSNDGRFRFPTNPDDDRRTNTQYTWNPQEVQIYYPFAERKMVGEAVPPGYAGPIESTPQLLPRPSEYYINTTMPIWTWEVLIKEEEREAAQMAMLKQSDHIHQINGRFCRFRTGGLDFFDVINGARTYVARYSWIDDAGTQDTFLNPILPDFVSQNGQHPTSAAWKYFPKPSVPVGRTFATGIPMTRFPHHTVKYLETIYVPGSPEPKPVFIQQCDFAIDLLGWQTLIGL